MTPNYWPRPLVCDGEGVTLPFPSWQDGTGNAVGAQWRFGETWFVYENGWFMCTIESPKESTIEDIKAKYQERLKEWESEQ